MSTTKAAGSARVAIAVTTGPSRGQPATERSAGVVDFSTGSHRLTTTSTSVPRSYVSSLVEVRVGGQTFFRTPAPGVPGIWVDSVGTGIERAFGADAQVFGTLGSTTGIWQVQELGPSLVGGGTRYRLTVRPPAPIFTPTTVRPPTAQLWVGEHGRLVRPQLTQRFRVRTPTGARSTWHTSVETVELSGVGTPLTITPPLANQVQQPPRYHSTLHVHTGCS